MEKKNIIITKSGIVNAGWEKFAVYFIGVPTIGDVHYIGKARNLLKRTGYTVDIETYKCINKDSGRFPLVLWNNDTVTSYLNTTIRSDLTRKTDFLDIVEDGGIQLFRTFDSGKGNKTRKNLTQDDIHLGSSIIVFTRKYNIIESIRLSLLIYKDIDYSCRNVKLLDTDSPEIKKIKREFCNIQDEFFKNLSAGKFIVQQGMGRDIYSVEESGNLYVSKDIKVSFGSHNEMYDMIRDGFKYISNCNNIYILKNDEGKQYVVFLVRPYTYEFDKYIDLKEINNFLYSSEIRNYLSFDLVDLINRQINFIPIE